MILTTQRIALLAERLHLPDLAAELRVFAKEAATKSWSFADFAEKLFGGPAVAANRRAEATLVCLASSPYHKSLEDFNFASQPSV